MLHQFGTQQNALFDICLDWFYMEISKKLWHHVIVQNLPPQDAATTTLAIME